MYTIRTTKNNNPLLNEVIVSNEKTNLKSIIYPNLGASLQSLSFNGFELIDGISNDEKGIELYRNKYNSSILFPSPNRISDGKYSFENKDYQLEINEAGLNNRLHGHVFNKNFLVSKIEENENNASVTFSYKNNGNEAGFPFSYKLDVTYTFSKNKLSLDFKVKNTGNTAFPFGIGWHPYFNAKNLNDAILDFNGSLKYKINEKMIPISETDLTFKTPLTVEDTFLDDCFILNEPKTSFKTDAYKIEIDFTSETQKSYLQVYTPPTRDCIAIEPMTCAPDCFNNKNGLLVLDPSKSYDWKINLNY
tara:strand:- start:4492 stop:5406 length:915 start_codon:yes stop_codon:yes gene_type:complete